VAARSHARRLEDAGWLERTPMVRGQGSLFAATRSSVRMAGLVLTAPSTPSPNTWAHHSACAWVAAWLTTRGRHYLGPRELLEEATWSGQLFWLDSNSGKRSGHRPDLVGFVNDSPVPIEVELAPKSQPRLDAILGLHQAWLIAGKSVGIIYVCGDRIGAERIGRTGRGLGLADGWLRIEPLDEIRQQTCEAGGHRASA
jgi:hypothetical protein